VKVPAAYTMNNEETRLFRQIWFRYIVQLKFWQGGALSSTLAYYYSLWSIVAVRPTSELLPPNFNC
jgi:hypothetical protein